MLPNQLAILPASLTLCSQPAAFEMYAHIYFLAFPPCLSPRDLRYLTFQVLLRAPQIMTQLPLPPPQKTKEKNKKTKKKQKISLLKNRPECAHDSPTQPNPTPALLKCNVEQKKKPVAKVQGLIESQISLTIEELI